MGRFWVCAFQLFIFIFFGFSLVSLLFFLLLLLPGGMMVVMCDLDFLANLFV